MPSHQELSIASVLLDHALDKPLDYLIPVEWQGKLLPGMRVKVPVKNSTRLATLFEIKDKSAHGVLKALYEPLSEKPYLSAELFKLARWVAHYYCAPLRKVLQVILPLSVRIQVKSKEQLFIQSSLTANELKSACVALRQKYPKQAQVLDEMLKSSKGLLLTLLIERAKVTRAAVQTLIKKGILTCVKVGTTVQKVEHEYFPTKPKTLNSEQQSAFDSIYAALESSTFQTHLLLGVTGSGKTEVYLQAMQAALKQGKGVIFLVPEIALTSQTIERLKGRFKEKIAILHHRITPKERKIAWEEIRAGKIPIVVGARSAIFSPVSNLGLIVVDEEHEASYKQSDEMPHYHARDVAVMRGKLEKAVVLLGSATPSLESYHNALSGKYRLHLLQTRHSLLPKVHLVDMHQEFTKAKGFTLFSQQLLDAIKLRLRRGEQTLLFLNRRGYHTARLCLFCDHLFQCPSCDISLTYHLEENCLSCHLCAYRLSPLPRYCPSCGKEEDFKFRGAGTELAQRTLHALFKEVRTLRIDADTTKHKGSHEELLKQFKTGKADVLIGTQMIAKGLHLPAVTLVGVLNADAGLQIPDFRASETIFQLLTQVAGRSGRDALQGEVIIQTQLLDHPVITLSKEQNYSAFYALEIETRRSFHYPPFSHLVKLSFSGEEEKEVQEYAFSVRSDLLQRLPPSFQLFPVVASGYARVKKKFRFQFLIKAEKIQPLLTLLPSLQAEKSEVRLSVDVDPLSTFY